jgi:type IV pilus assembly protein PilM
MQRILGLDIGSFSIKAVEIQNSFKTYRITRFYEIEIPEIEGLDHSIVGMTAVRQLFTEHNLDADRTYTAMMGLLVSLRMFRFQNVKKRNIPIVVQNEFESQAPFSLDEVVIDQQVIGTQGDSTQVLSVLCRKDHVEAFLSGLKDLNIEPKIIDVDYLAFMNLYPFIKFVDKWRKEEEPDLESSRETKRTVQSLSSTNACRLILDIGHAKTALILFNQGTLVAARTIKLGGRFFTDHLQKSLGITFQEAHRLKHAVSRIVYRHNDTPTPGKENEFLVAKHLGIAVTELVKELVRTLHSFKAQEKLIPTSILICGGGSKIINLPDYFEEVLEIPVNRLEFTDSNLKFDEPALANFPQIAQTLAIGLRGVPSKTQSHINLRSGDLAFVGSYDTVFRHFTNVTLAFCAIATCFGVSYGVRWYLFSQQIELLRAQYKKEVVATLGTEPKVLKNISASSNWNLKNYATQANKIILDEVKARDTILTAMASKKSAAPLRVLEEVSTSIPKETKIDVTHFSVAGGNLLIEGETDSFATSEKILEAVKSVQSLSAVERKSQENKPGSDGKVIKFTLSASIKEGN